MPAHATSAAASTVLNAVAPAVCLPWETCWAQEPPPFSAAAVVPTGARATLNFPPLSFRVGPVAWRNSIMSPHTGFVLVNEIFPRLKRAIPNVVCLVGCEDVQELIQDATAIAAKLLHSAPLLVAADVFRIELRGRTKMS